MNIYFNKDKISLEEKSAVGYFDTVNPTAPLYEDVFDIYKISTQIKQNPNGVILVNCGCFNPIHDGHVKMLEVSEQLFKARGITVLDKVLVPANDEYVGYKKGDKALNIFERIAYIHRTYPEYNVDNWVGIFNQSDVNIIDVLLRIEHIVNKHFGSNVKVYGTIGGDNAYMANILQYVDNKNVGFIVVNRPGSDNHTVINDERILRVNGSSSLSSTELLSKSNFNDFKPVKVKKYSIRTNESKIERKIIKVLRNYIPQDAVVEINTLKEDIETYKKFIQKEVERNSNSAFVFADTLVKAYEKELKEITPNIFFYFNSRIYSTGGYKRIGQKEHSNNIPPLKEFDKVYVLDDDQFYLDEDSSQFEDKTFNRIKKSLIKKDLITDETDVEFLTLRRYTIGEEIIDARDFNPKDKNGGIFMQRTTEDEAIRTPYYFPYVCPFTRASIQDAIRFSEEIKKIK